MPFSTASSPAPSSKVSVEFAPERAEDERRVDALIDRAFGPGRFAKTAERLREGNRLRRDLSICAWAGGELVGAVRLWPILIGAEPAVFLGPIAVDSAWRRQRLGGELIERASRAAADAGESAILLVGDMPLFGPYAYQRAPAEIVLPGPVDPRRVLWRPLKPGAERMSGLVSAPRPA